MISKLNNYIWYWLCLFLIWLLLFSFVSFLQLIRNDSLEIKNEIKNFEKETWLNIDQLTEKYNVDLSTIYERYQEIKSNIQNDNKQTLEEELFNALTKHK